MTHRPFPRWIFAGLAALTIVNLGSVLYNVAWSKGFAMGMLAAQSEASPLMAQQFAHGMGHGAFHHGPGGGFLIPLFLLFAFFMVARRRFWRHHGQHGWHKHGCHGQEKEVPVEEKTSQGIYS